MSPEFLDVYHLLKEKSADWNGFRRELWLDGNYGDTLARDRSLTDDDRLDKVLTKWIDTRSSPVTWNKILEMLRELELLNIADKVKTYLKKEEVIEKYSKKNIFSG